MVIKKIFPIIALLFLLVSCEETIESYNGESGIYFDTKGMVTDTIRVPWGLKSSDIKEQTIKLKVCLFGNTADHDRTFNVLVSTDQGNPMAATENTDYKPIATQYVLPANAAEMEISIDLLRSQTLKTQPKCFTVSLVESPELKFLYTREISEMGEDSISHIRQLDYQRVILMNENFEKPAWWNVYGTGYFGTWSQTKAALICDVMGIDREVWMLSDGTGLTQGYLKFVGKYMYNWLQEHPTLDEDGNPMQMGTQSQV